MYRHKNQLEQAIWFERALKFGEMKRAGDVRHALGRTPEECLGRKCYTLFNTGHCNTPECRVARAMNRNSVCTGDTTANLSSGELPIRYTGAPITDESGNVVGGLEYVLDISKEMEITDGLLSLTSDAMEGKLTARGDEGCRIYAYYRLTINRVKKFTALFFMTKKRGSDHGPGRTRRTGNSHASA